MAKEFNAIPVDDGIAMDHGRMLYLMPSREVIANSVEYICNAHTTIAMANMTGGSRPRDSWERFMVITVHPFGSYAAHFAE